MLRKNKSLLILVIFLTIEIKLTCGPLLVIIGNNRYHGNALSQAVLSYTLSKPAIFQSARVDYNIAQANYFRKNYTVSRSQFYKVFNKTNEISLKCDAIIQYVNSDLRLIENELDNGKVEQYRDRILQNIDFLKQCLELDKSNKIAKDNVELLEKILTEKTSEVPESDVEKSNHAEKEALNQDNEAQKKQREFNQTDSGQNTFIEDTTKPNW